MQALLFWEETMTLNRDWRLEGLENFGAFQPFFTVGKFEIPVLAPVTELKPLEWRCFGERRTNSFTRETGVHFFTDDYRFTSVWRQPQKYADMFARAGAVMTPDFSMYRDMPLSLQIYNHYRKHWCGQFWQSRGVVVIPTISWSGSESWDFCFDGEPRGSIVAVSTVGVKRDKEAFGLFSAGWSEMLDRLSPKRVIVCGEVFDFMTNDVVIESFGAFTDKFVEMRKEG